MSYKGRVRVRQECLEKIRPATRKTRISEIRWSSEG
jgi:hypothetical protein